MNLAVGQGFFLATSLQVANVYAAIARKGTLTTPVLVGKQVGSSVQFQTRQKGTLPVQPPTPETTRQAMIGVTSVPQSTA